MSDKWQVVRRWAIASGPVYQCAVYKWGEWIFLGPYADTLDELRNDLEAMRRALDQPVVDLERES